MMSKLNIYDFFIPYDSLTFAACVQNQVNFNDIIMHLDRDIENIIIAFNSQFKILSCIWYYLC